MTRDELFEQFRQSTLLSESSGGANLDHPVVSKGMHAGYAAAGRYGLMPITIMERLEKDPELREAYGQVLSRLRSIDSPQDRTHYLRLLFSNPQGQALEEAVFRSEFENVYKAAKRGGGEPSLEAMKAGWIGGPGKATEYAKFERTGKASPGLQAKDELGTSVLDYAGAPKLEGRVAGPPSAAFAAPQTPSQASPRSEMTVTPSLGGGGPYDPSAAWDKAVPQQPAFMMPQGGTMGLSKDYAQPPAAAPGEQTAMMGDKHAQMALQSELAAESAGMPSMEPSMLPPEPPASPLSTPQPTQGRSFLQKAGNALMPGQPFGGPPRREGDKTIGGKEIRGKSRGQAKELAVSDIPGYSELSRRKQRKIEKLLRAGAETDRAGAYGTPNRYKKDRKDRKLSYLVDLAAAKAGDEDGHFNIGERASLYKQHYPVKGEYTRQLLEL